MINSQTFTYSKTQEATNNTNTFQIDLCEP